MIIMVSAIDNRGLGLRIAYYRKLNRITQRKLAERVNISEQYMSKIERGNVSNCVSLPVLNNISNELGVSIDILINGREFT